MKKVVLVFVAFMLFASCDSTKALKTINDILDTAGTGTGVSDSEIGAGLKEALNLGVVKGVNTVSVADGFLKNAEIKIPWPSEVEKIASTLNQFGMGGLVDKVETSLNRAAEKAAVEAKPIFMSAIKQLTFKDVMGILKGDSNAATEYLRRTTSSELTSKFKPIIQNSLNQVNATKYWDEVAQATNKPLIKQALNVDVSAVKLDEYVTNKALEGLFTMVAKEELKIRKDPLARTSDILKRVFSLQDTQNTNSNKNTNTNTKPTGSGSNTKQLNKDK